MPLFVPWFKTSLNRPHDSVRWGGTEGGRTIGLAFNLLGWGLGAFQAFSTHCSEHLVYKWRGLLWWGVGDFACHGLTCTGPHRCAVRAVTLLLVKLCVPVDPQEEWRSPCVTALKIKRWMWENIPGEKLIGTWERDEDYLFVYHNWARKKRRKRKLNLFDWNY